MAIGAPKSILSYFDILKFSSYPDRYFLQNLIISQIDKIQDNWKSKIFRNLAQTPKKSTLIDWRQRSHKVGWNKRNRIVGPWGPIKGAFIKISAW